MEILFTIFYAIFIGFYNIFKKLAVGKTNESVVLVLYTSVAFLLSLMWIPFGLKIPLKFVLIFAIKGFLLASSWFILLKILKTADLSVVTVTRVLSSVLTFILGVCIFSESASVGQIVAMAIIILSVALINLCNKNSDGKITTLNLYECCYSVFKLITLKIKFYEKKALNSCGFKAFFNGNKK